VRRILFQTWVRKPFQGISKIRSEIPEVRELNAHIYVLIYVIAHEGNPLNNRVPAAGVFLEKTVGVFQYLWYIFYAKVSCIKLRGNNCSADLNSFSMSAAVWDFVHILQRRILYRWGSHSVCALIFIIYLCGLYTQQWFLWFKPNFPDHIDAEVLFLCVYMVGNNMTTYLWTNVYYSFR